MKIHEYQAASLLKEYGIPVSLGEVASTANEAKASAERIGGKCVVKAQIHSGGRGKAGGVKLVESSDEAAAAAEAMLGKMFVTKQTGPEGKVAQKVYVTEVIESKKEYYFSATVDNDAAGLVLIASAAGGMEIEEVAASQPEQIIRNKVMLDVGYKSYQGYDIARQIGLPKENWKEFSKIAENIVRLFVEKDCSLVEINPLVITADGKLMALDAKVNFDDNGLNLHPDCVAMRDIGQEDSKEVQAAKFDLSYIALNGNIGCLVNGAGLAMATMDIILKFGGVPANFLDVGGGAGKEKVKAAFEILLSDPNVKAIFINIFGGIMKCDVLAQGVVDAANELGIKVPLIVRLEGTNVEKGNQILKESGLALIPATDMAEGARMAVKAAKGKEAVQ